MAKQLGVGEAALAGLEDPDRFPFPPEERAALRLADAMTRDGGEVDDALFGEVRRHFDEAQVVELACVVGLFNYFNRFNNALRMPITLGDVPLLLSRMRATLSGSRTAVGDALRIAAAGRRLACLALYRGARADGVPMAAAGEAPPPGRTAGPVTACEMAVPITDPSGRITGTLLAIAAAGRHLDSEDHQLLRRAAALLGETLDEAGGDIGGPR